MTGAVEGAWASWWPYRGKPDVVAHEVVGPLAIADLVAVQFDQSALRARASAGIRPLSDYAALAAAFACQRAARRTADLVPLLGLGESSVRRALRLACEAGVVEAVDRGRYRTHRDWSRVGHRLVALELKKAAWQRAAEQVGPTRVGPTPLGWCWARGHPGRQWRRWPARVWGSPTSTRTRTCGRYCVRNLGATPRASPPHGQPSRPLRLRRLFRPMDARRSNQFAPSGKVRRRCSRAESRRRLHCAQ